MYGVLWEYLQIPPLPATETVSILVRFANQEDERGRHNVDAANVPQYSFGVCWEAEVQAIKCKQQ